VGSFDLSSIDRFLAGQRSLLDWPDPFDVDIGDGDIGDGGEGDALEPPFPDDG
jgi:hypothetical protein